MTKGHVFVTMGDLLNLRSAAFLLPLDRRATPGDRWKAALPGLEEAMYMQDLSSIREESAFALALDNWDLGSPLPVLTAVPMTGIVDVQELLPRCRGFVEVASAAVTGRQSSSSSQVSRPGLAPAVGQ